MANPTEPIASGVKPETTDHNLSLGDKIRLGLDVVKIPFYALYRKRLESKLHSWVVPNHIGIIMDGNRRFAKESRYQNLVTGHVKGAEKLEEVLNWCEEAKVKVVTVWIFSLDNFSRGSEEVEGLMKLFEKKFTELVTHPRIHRNQIRVRALGQTDKLPQPLREAIESAEKATAHYTRRVFNIGVAYGGREEIVEAMRSYLSQKAENGATVEEIAKELSPESIEPFLYTSHVPDPD